MHLSPSPKVRAALYLLNKPEADSINIRPVVTTEHCLPRNKEQVLGIEAVLPGARYLKVNVSQGRVFWSQQMA